MQPMKPGRQPMSHIDLHSEPFRIGPMGREAMRFAIRRLLIGSAVVLGDLVLLGVLLIYGGIFAL